MSDRPDKPKSKGKTRFWVLVDGQVRYESGQVSRQDSTTDIHVKLSESDRFLTLIVDEATEAQGNILWDDWAMFAEPVLKLQ